MIIRIICNQIGSKKWNFHYGSNNKKMPKIECLYAVHRYNLPYKERFLFEWKIFIFQYIITVDSKQNDLDMKKVDQSRCSDFRAKTGMNLNVWTHRFFMLFASISDFNLTHTLFQKGSLIDAKYRDFWNDAVSIAPHDWVMTYECFNF